MTVAETVLRPEDSVADLTEQSDKGPHPNKDGGTAHGVADFSGGPAVICFPMYEPVLPLPDDCATPTGELTARQKLAQRLFYAGAGSLDQAPVWKYINRHGWIKGPYDASSMTALFCAGRLTESMLACGSDAKLAKPYRPGRSFYYQLRYLLNIMQQQGGDYRVVDMEVIAAGRGQAPADWQPITQAGDAEGADASGTSSPLKAEESSEAPAAPSDASQEVLSGRELEQAGLRGIPRRLWAQQQQQQQLQGRSMAGLAPPTPRGTPQVPGYLPATPLWGPRGARLWFGPPPPRSDARTLFPSVQPWTPAAAAAALTPPSLPTWPPHAAGTMYPADCTVPPGYRSSSGTGGLMASNAGRGSGAAPASARAPTQPAGRQLGRSSSCEASEQPGESRLNAHAAPYTPMSAPMMPAAPLAGQQGSTWATCYPYCYPYMAGGMAPAYSFPSMPYVMPYQMTPMYMAPPPPPMYYPPNGMEGQTGNQLK